MSSPLLDEHEWDQLRALLDLNEGARAWEQLRDAGADMDLLEVWERVANLPGPVLLFWPVEDENDARVVGKVGAFFTAPTGRSPAKMQTHAGWIASAFLALRDDGTLTLRQLVLEPERQMPSDNGVSELVLRSVKPAQLLAKAHAFALALPQAHAVLERHGLAPPPQVERERATRVSRRLANVKLKRGRNGYPDELYRWVAETYVELVEKETRGVHAEIARRATKQRLVRRRVAPQTVRDWIHIARARGFLTPAVRGRAGGGRGPNL